MPIFDESVLLNRLWLAEQAIAKAIKDAGNAEDLESYSIFFAGEPIPKPGVLADFYPFLPCPEYAWLSGSSRSGGVLVYESGQGGRWVHFVRPVSTVEKVWEGNPPIPEGEPAEGFRQYFEKNCRGRQYTVLGSSREFPDVIGDHELNRALQENMDRVRRHKDEAELALIRKAIAATAAGFGRLREWIRPGASERRVQIELEAEMFRAGATGTSFGTIVAAGSHASILHFRPLSAEAREIAPQELVLVDAGAEIHGYAADVTRTFPAGEKFTTEQQAIYDLVLSAQRAGINACQVGTEWHDVHRAAARVIGEGLLELGILRGTLNEVLGSGAVALFFTHGVGHVVGRARDVTWRIPERRNSPQCCGVRVRVDFPLEENDVMTVEPGIYFNPALLDDPDMRLKHSTRVNWDALERWRPVGGVRIEDDVLITAGGPEVLTAAIPK